MTGIELDHVAKIAKEIDVPYNLGNHTITFYPHIHHYTYSIYPMALAYLSRESKRNQITQKPKGNHLF